MHVIQYGDVTWLPAKMSNYLPANVAERMSCMHMQTTAILMSRRRLVSFAVNQNTLMSVVVFHIFSNSWWHRNISFVTDISVFILRLSILNVVLLLLLAFSLFCKSSVRSKVVIVKFHYWILSLAQFISVTSFPKIHLRLHRASYLKLTHPGGDGFESWTSTDHPSCGFAFPRPTVLGECRYITLKSSTITLSSLLYVIPL
jgi:hypothetical protein